ncbi:MAG: hypothetical protein IKC09_07820 [Oscillospiraceae bacterium]|nr:hypothetical protein [Oscillospiraceae bacterium]MBR2890164.1 hypothetical protein [Oscillospiraceae bacterium]
MKKRFWKILALVLALALTFGLAAFANSLVGNPVSKWLAQRGAEEYLLEHYPDCYVDSLGFNFKFTSYYAHIRSKDSIDTQFTLQIDYFGRVYYDTYESVEKGYVTERRLDDAYRAMTERILDDPSMELDFSISFGELCISEGFLIGDPQHYDIPEFSMALEELERDKEYDIRELGARCGKLVVYVGSPEVTFEKAAEIMLLLRERFDRDGVPFKAMDFVLHPPKSEDGPWMENEIRVENFLYEDISPEGLAQRIQTAHEALAEFYAYLDSEKIK